MHREHTCSTAVTETPAFFLRKVLSVKVKIEVNGHPSSFQINWYLQTECSGKMGGKFKILINDD